MSKKIIFVYATKEQGNLYAGVKFEKLKNFKYNIKEKGKDSYHVAIKINGIREIENTINQKEPFDLLCEELRREYAEKEIMNLHINEDREKGILEISFIKKKDSNVINIA